jgi:hypothetical protein
MNTGKQIITLALSVLLVLGATGIIYTFASTAKKTEGSADGGNIRQSDSVLDPDSGGDSDTVSEPEHVHTVVTDEEIPASCTTDGKTAGSHCETCGEIITKQKTIYATGHSYEDKICTICGEVLNGYVLSTGIYSQSEGRTTNGMDTGKWYLDGTKEQGVYTATDDTLTLKLSAGESVALSYLYEYGKSTYYIWSPTVTITDLSGKPLELKELYSAFDEYAMKIFTGNENYDVKVERFANGNYCSNFDYGGTYLSDRSDVYSEMLRVFFTPKTDVIVTMKNVSLNALEEGLWFNVDSTVKAYSCGQDMTWKEYLASEYDLPTGYDFYLDESGYVRTAVVHGLKGDGYLTYSYYDETSESWKDVAVSGEDKITNRKYNVLYPQDVSFLSYQISE